MAVPFASKRRRLATRDAFWPGCSDRVWPQPANGSFADGWTKLPKYMPAIFAILSERGLNQGMDLGPVYIELLTRVFDEGLVELTDEAEHAHLSGLSSPKIWRKRVRRLEELGFIRTFERIPGKLGYVVLVHPLAAIIDLNREGTVPDQAWQVFQRRLIDLNIDLEKASRHFGSAASSAAAVSGDASEQADD